MTTGIKWKYRLPKHTTDFKPLPIPIKATEFYGKADASGTLNFQTKKVLLKEGKLTGSPVGHQGLFVL